MDVGPEAARKLMHTSFHLDYESRSEVDLDVRGLDNYVKDPTTEIILAAYAEGDHKVKLWQPHLEPIPNELREALEDPFVTVAAWNASFERAMSKHKLGIDKPVSEWVDTMVNARYVSLPGSLDHAGEILKIGANFQKMEEGDRLIRKFCTPAIYGGEDTLYGISETKYRDWNSDPEDWELFCEYNKRDVVAERAQHKKLARHPLPFEEQQNWEMDQRINERGLPADLDVARGAKFIADKEMARLRAELKELTNLENPNSNEQLLVWAKDQGYIFSSLGKAFVARAMAGEGSLSDLGRRVLEIRKFTSKSSVHKYSRILDTVSSDGRLRYQFSFMGASRTGRWSGKGSADSDASGVQMQNLSRPAKSVEKRLDLALELVRKMDYDAILKEFGQPLEVASSVIRSVFCAGEGKKLVICDLSAIENRVLGWLARCPSILRVFADGLDPYIDFATELYGKNYEDVTKEERTNSKPAVLGCFGADTLVITDRGWVRIVDVQKTDKLWDGEEWVAHEGVLDQGIKPIIRTYGIDVTPEHEILVGKDWRTAWDVSRNFHYAWAATSLATGSLSRAYQTIEADSATNVGVKHVGSSKLSTDKTSNEGKQDPAFPAQMPAFGKKWAAYMNSLMSLVELSAGSQTDITPSPLDAAEKVELRTATGGEALYVNSRVSMTLLRTALPSQTSTKSTIKSTESTMMGTTRSGTFDSCLPRSIAETKKFINLLNGTDVECPQSNFGKNTVPGIETEEQSAESSEKDCLRSKSSLTNQNAKVRTYDILNAGPRHRFMIVTLLGPMIAHNCGYQLGGGEEIVNENGDLIKTGLLGYAAAYGVNITQHEAERAVALFRSKYKEVPELWYDLERASTQCLKTSEPQTVGPVTFDLPSKKMLRILLPSGRHLHYIEPEIHKQEFTSKGKTYTKATLSYMGVNQKTRQWERISTRGGALTENLCQAIARDILVHGMRLAEENGLTVIGHVHDEIISEVFERESDALGRLIRCMSTPPSWALDLPLAAAGFESKYYRKD